MQRDLKIGLSLGVLLLGVVGALLFRKETPDSPTAPLLKSGKEIDDRISERPRTPYMTGEVEFEQDEFHSRQYTEEDVSLTQRPAHTVPPSWLVNDEESEFPKRSSDRRSRPNPLRDESITLLPIETTEDNSVGSSSATGAAPASKSMKQHTIKSGETLSSIAELYFGSQSRFKEIFDANRQTLNDPNRLPLGATILIPIEKNTTSLAHAIENESPSHQPESRPSGSSERQELDLFRKPKADIVDVQPIRPQVPAIVTSNELQTPASKLSVESVKRFVAPQRRNAFPPSARVPSSVGTPDLTERVVSPEVPLSQSDLSPGGDTQHSTANGGTIKPRTYQVQRGDTLEKIAQRIYGNPRRATEIFANNRDRLNRLDEIREGMELLLPE